MSKITHGLNLVDRTIDGSMVRPGIAKCLLNAITRKGRSILMFGAVIAVLGPFSKALSQDQELRTPYTKIVQGYNMYVAEQNDTGVPDSVRMEHLTVIAKATAALTRALKKEIRIDIQNQAYTTAGGKIHVLVLILESLQKENPQDANIAGMTETIGELQTELSLAQANAAESSVQANKEIDHGPIGRVIPQEADGFQWLTCTQTSADLQIAVTRATDSLKGRVKDPRSISVVKQTQQPDGRWVVTAKGM